MSNLEAIRIVEKESISIDQARAVLREATRYFETVDSDKLKLLPEYAPHILELLYVTDKLLQNVSPELSKAVAMLFEMRKAGDAA